jgi:hypothetical protein
MRRRWWLQLTQAVTDRDVRHAESAEKLRAQLASLTQAETRQRQRVVEAVKRCVVAALACLQGPVGSLGKCGW